MPASGPTHPLGSQALLSRRAVLAALLAAAWKVPAGATESWAVRGMNLSDWEGNPGLAQDYLQPLRAFGINAVRLPINGDPLAGADRLERHLAMLRLERFATVCLEHGMEVMLDLHTSPGITGALEADFAEGAQAAERAWRGIAEVAADLPPHSVSLELINEPPVDTSHWLHLRDRLAARIRSRCPHNTLVWGAPHYQTIWETMAVPPLADTNAMAAVHFYWPMAFTHQCEGWLGSGYGRLQGLPFPTEAGSPQVMKLRQRLLEAKDKEALQVLDDAFLFPWAVQGIVEEFDKLRQWSVANDCPVVLNEFGTLKGCTDPASRAAWTRAVRTAAERTGIGWYYWELREGFGVLDQREQQTVWDMSMIEALLQG